MLNSQRLIICCLLFAALWMQSLKAEISDEDQKILEPILNVFYREASRTKEDRGHFYHFNSWKSWPLISHELMMQIARDYNKMVEKEGTVDYTKETEIANSALDNFFEKQLKIIKTNFNIKKKARTYMENLKKEGRFWEYLAFINNESNKKKIEATLESLREKYAEIQIGERALQLEANLKTYFQERSSASGNADAKKNLPNKFIGWRI